MSDEKAVIPVEMTTRGVALTTIDDAWRFCDAIASTEMVPKSMRGKPAEVFAVVQAGAELGVTPFRALANVKIINGRVGPMGALAKALVRAAGVLEKGTGFLDKFTGTEFEDDFTAHFTTLRKGETDVRTSSFSVADAKRAGLWDKKSQRGEPSPWVLYPKRMLTWRAVGFHMDDYYADVLMGFHIAEVLEDYPPERVAAVMEPVETPTADPLLDQLEVQADPEKELADIAAELRPPDVPEGVNAETGEYESEPIDAEWPDKDPPTPADEVRAQLPDEWIVTGQAIANAIDIAGIAGAAGYLIDQHEAAMNSGQALPTAGEIRQAMEAVEDKDLDDPDPGNAVAEGAEADDLP